MAEKTFYDFDLDLILGIGGTRQEDGSFLATSVIQRTNLPGTSTNFGPDCMRSIVGEPRQVNGSYLPTTVLQRNNLPGTSTNFHPEYILGVHGETRQENVSNLYHQPTSVIQKNYLPGTSTNQLTQTQPTFNPNVLFPISNTCAVWPEVRSLPAPELSNAAPVDGKKKNSNRKQSTPKKTQSTKDTKKKIPKVVKRKGRCEEDWKQNTRKRLRATGQSYVSTRGKVIPAKKFVEEPCPCKKKCHDNFTIEERKKIFDSYYKLANYNLQTAFIFAKVKVIEKACCRAKNGSSRRKFTRIFTLPNKKGDVKVCSNFFQSTLQISKSRVTQAIRNKNNVDRITAPVDKRGGKTRKLKLIADCGPECILGGDVETPQENDSDLSTSVKKINLPGTSTDDLTDKPKNKNAEDIITAPVVKMKKTPPKTINDFDSECKLSSDVETRQENGSVLQEINLPGTSTNELNDKPKNENAKEIFTAPVDRREKMMLKPMDNFGPGCILSSGVENRLVNESELSTAVLIQQLNLPGISTNLTDKPKKRKRRKRGEEPTPKKQRCEERWQRNIQKKCRATGQEYVTRQGKVVPAKKFNDEPCPCKQKCHKNFTIEERKKIFDSFYKLANYNLQTAFIFSQVKVIEKARCRAKNGSTRRKFTRIFTLPNKKGDVKVCCNFFKSALQVSNSRVTQAIRNKKDEDRIVAPVDKRGKAPPATKTPQFKVEAVQNFIKQFPGFDSYYCSKKKTDRKTLPPNLNVVILHKLYKEKEPEKLVSLTIFRKIFKEIYPSL